MKTSDILKALTLIKVAYPQAFNKMSPQEMDAMANLWMIHFRDKTAEELSYAVNFYIANNTSGFAPTIGELNDIIYRHYHPEISEFEAWSAFKKALPQCSDLPAARKEWAQLPETVKAMTNPGDLCRIAKMNTDQVDTTVAAMLRKSVTVVNERIKEQAQLPSSIKNLLSYKPMKDDSNDGNLG